MPLGGSRTGRDCRGGPLAQGRQAAPMLQLGEGLRAAAGQLEEPCLGYEVAGLFLRPTAQAAAAWRQAAQTAYASGAEPAGAMRRAPAAGGARWNRIGAAAGTEVPG